MMNQLAALRETIRLAEESGMPELPGSDVGLAHLRRMAVSAEAGNFGAAKLGRWLGWAQCALVAANVGVTLADMKSLNARWSIEEVAPTESPHLEIDSSSAVSAASGLEGYPWVVWTVMLLDPERIAGVDVAERTAAAATAAAELYGCVYEYCVEDDSMPDGTKYYKWYVGVTQAEHQQRVGNVPTVVAELLGGLIGSLPSEVDVDQNWTAGPDIHATRHRNEVDRGYPGHS